MVDIKQILEVLNSHHFNGGGDHIEIAKGSKELCTTFSGMKTKLLRLWQKK